MIRRLRWKFVTILMAVISLFLVIILTTMYYTNKMGYEQRSMGMLQMALQDSREPRRDPSFSGGETGGETAPEPRPDQDRQSAGPPAQDRFPVLVAEQDGEGNVRILLNRIYQLDEDDVGSLIRQASQQNRRGGILTRQSLRFLLDPDFPDGSVRYAFADISQEQYALRWQIIYSFIIGFLALAAFLAVSVWLSRWATRPTEEAWQAQQQFVSDASHELKTPLTVILANISLLKQSPGITDRDDCMRIDHIDSEASRMKLLTESLLTLARSDGSSRKKTEDFTPLDFSYLVESCVSTFEPVAFEMGKSICSHIAEKLTVNGSEAKLRQLADILLDNGCKYSRDKSCIQVNVKQEGSEAVFSVTTEGPPLRPEELKQLFRRFYRADPSRGKVEGFGLGLSIAQAVCAEHKGKITASTDGVGANTFTVRLPLCRRDSDLK